MRPIRRTTTAAMVVAGLALSLVACSTPGDDPGPALPVDPAALYAQMCARCHALDGRGDPELRKTLPVRDFADPVFLARATSDETGRIIMMGKNQMPSFGGLLSMPKVQSLSGYVIRLGRASARAAATAPARADVPAPAAGAFAPQPSVKGSR
jgi:mono/diheme cytochrome c family protein